MQIQGSRLNNFVQGLTFYLNKFQVRILELAFGKTKLNISCFVHYLICCRLVAFCPKGLAFFCLCNKWVCIKTLWSLDLLMWKPYKGKQVLINFGCTSLEQRLFENWLVLGFFLDSITIYENFGLRTCRMFSYGLEALSIVHVAIRIRRFQVHDALQGHDHDIIKPCYDWYLGWYPQSLIVSTIIFMYAMIQWGCAYRLWW